MREATAISFVIWPNGERKGGGHHYRLPVFGQEDKVEALAKALSSLSNVAHVAICKKEPLQGWKVTGVYIDEANDQ